MNFIMMGLLILLLSMALFKPALVIAFVNSWVQIIPFGYAAIRTCFGKFSKKKKSGLIFTVPILHKIELVPLELPSSAPIIASAQTKDGDLVDFEVELEYKVDFSFIETYFYAVKDNKDQFEKMVASSIITLIGNIASTKTLDQLYQQREALWLAINCHARLSKMPHIDQTLIGLPVKHIKSDKVLDFYDKQKKAIDELVKKEEENKNDYSAIELRYGIDVKTVGLIKITFSKETQEAINKKKGDESMAKAAEFKINLIKRFQEECKLSPEAAKQAAEASLKQTTKNDAYSVLGLQGAINVDLRGKSE